VIPRHTAWVAEPAHVLLQPSERTASFRLVPSCVLRIHVLHEDRSPFEEPFQTVRQDAGTQQVRNGMFTTNPERTGRFDDAVQIRPGTYRVRVSADGYATWTSEPLTFSRQGEALDVEATLKADPSKRSGTLVLSIPVAEQAGICWYRVPAPSGTGAPGISVRERGGDWFEPGGGRLTAKGEMRVTEVSWDESSRQLRVRVPAAAYEALVWDRASWTCGYLGGLSLTADGVATGVVRLVPGARVRVADLKSADPLSPGDLLVQDLRVRADGVNDLPAVEFVSGSSSSAYRLDPVPRDVALAPLPFDVLHVTWRGAAEKRYSMQDVRAAPSK
jgi:hypothetical protein